MDFSRVSGGEKIAGASGLALLVFMLPDWFYGGNGWQFRLIDLVLFLIGALAIGTVCARAAGGGRVRGGTPNLVLTLAGAVGLGIMLTLFLESDGRTIALVLSVLAVAGILYGGFTAMDESERASGQGRPPAEPPGRGASR